MLILQDLRLKLLTDDLMKDKEILLTHAQNQSFSRTFSFEKKTNWQQTLKHKKLSYHNLNQQKVFHKCFLVLQ